MQYRVYFLEGGHIRAAHAFVAEDDIEARQISAVLLHSTSDVFEFYELWSSTRRIATVPRHLVGAQIADLGALAARHDQNLKDAAAYLRRGCDAVRKCQLMMDRLSQSNDPTIRRPDRRPWPQLILSGRSPRR